MIKAKVEWFDKKKGFGIAKSFENELEYFIHYSELSLSDDFKGYLLPEEEIVINNYHSKNGKLCAEDVKPLKEKFLCENEKLEKKKRNRKKNTETFEPCYDTPDMTIKMGGSNKYKKPIYSRDIILVSNIFEEETELYGNIYEKLIEEIKNSGVNDEKLWKLWHGDTHTIADDKEGWKKKCPLFNKIISKVKDYFNMDIKATRFNWYKDTNDWKPFHHDAAAVKPEKAKTQNFTVGISFGYEREICFEHAKNRNKVSFPMSDGSIYAFTRDINIEWRHGIEPVSKENFCNEGRISIIAWGQVNMEN
jgi:cold shock CspA family protein